MELRRDGVDVRSILSQPKRLALLAYLATARPRGFHSRDALLGLFWPEADDDAARNRLRQALHQLRRSLSDDVFASRADHEVGINSEVLDCDAVKFDQALEAGRDEEALGLYRGEFLQGFYVDDAPEVERWIEAEREHRRHLAVAAAVRLAEREAAHNQPRAAVPWARMALTLSPYDESCARRLIALLNECGERATAQQVYSDYEKRLQADLELTPSEETRALVAVRTKPSVSSALAQSTPDAGGKDLYLSLAAAPSTPSRKRRTAKRPRAWYYATAAIVVLLTGSWIAVTRDAPAQPNGATIAVLPFINMSRDSANEYFSDGVTEEILNSLTSIQGLRVASRTSSFALKGQSHDVRVVGEKLGVANVLEGSVRRIGNRIKIAVQLVSVADGYQIWSQTYDREIDDIFAVQEEIARAITNALEIKLGHADDAALERRATSNTEAYDLYLRGKYLVTSRSEERNRKAIEYFEQAISRDSRFALPYAGLARAYIMMGEFVPPRSVLPKAKQAALRALQLDSSLVETRLALADVFQVYDRDWAAAEREIQHALAMSPQSASAHAAYANLMLDERRFDEAFVERQHAWQIRRAVSPDTLLPLFRIEEHVSWGGYYFHVGKLREALRHAEKALEIDPENVTALWLKVIIEQEMGNTQVAVAGLEKVRDLTNSEMPFLTHLGRAYAAAGRTKDARAILDQLLARAQKQYVPKDQIALLYLSLGDTTKALDMLELAVEDYHWWLPNANSHPLFRGLQSHPRFEELMKRIGARK